MSQSSARTVALSLVSHTNAGKTTLARTLLGRDVGVVRDEPHVTDVAESFVLVESPDGDRLVLWDTPGFGDSVRLARRLEGAGSPIVWLLSQVWDRFRDRPLWSSQQAVRNVREQADLVLYLVNASEDPASAGYVDPEMRVLEWIGRPVVVLLNQLGAPRPVRDEEDDVRRWHQQLSSRKCVRAVLPLDAFARCWVQEIRLFDTILDALPDESARVAFARLRATWLTRRRTVFAASMRELGDRLAAAALDREPIPEEGLRGQLRDLGSALGLGRDAADTPRKRGMQALAERLDRRLRESTDRLIALHDLSGQARGEILARLAEHYAISEPVSEGRAALLGGIVTGALTGLKADLAAGGMTFGAGLLAGGVVGALGAAGIAHGYNVVRGTEVSAVRWSDAMLDRLAASALLAYLAVAHYGRGRGQWSESEHPAHWEDAVSSVLASRGETFAHLWSLRDEREDVELARALGAEMEACATEVLARFYPSVDLAAILS
ncbi:MAG: DUF3482 domain-containing protein [Betaproteobacteria bacterium]|nr:DUF3482 domain-containing protein [Betaproteobacteria bacterium]